jgi:hypothetical protein
VPEDAFATPRIDCFPEPELISVPLHIAIPEFKLIPAESEPSPFNEMSPPTEFMFVPIDKALLD